MKCVATIWRPGERYNLTRTLRSYKSDVCSHKGTERLGRLWLCSVHARMCREGFVSENGETPSPNDRREYQRLGGKPYNWFYDWDSKNSRSNIAEEWTDLAEALWLTLGDLLERLNDALEHDDRIEPLFADELRSICNKHGFGPLNLANNATAKFIEDTNKKRKALK